MSARVPYVVTYLRPVEDKIVAFGETEDEAREAAKYMLGENVEIVRVELET